MQQDIFKKTEQDNNTAEKASWSKPQLEELDLGFTDGIKFPSAGENTSSGSS